MIFVRAKARLISGTSFPALAAHLPPITIDLDAMSRVLMHMK